MRCAASPARRRSVHRSRRSAPGRTASERHPRHRRRARRCADPIAVSRRSSVCSAPSHCIEVTDAELAAVNLTRDEFHPEWNYSISPPRDHANCLSTPSSVRTSPVPPASCEDPAADRRPSKGRDAGPVSAAMERPRRCGTSPIPASSGRTVCHCLMDQAAARAHDLQLSPTDLMMTRQRSSARRARADGRSRRGRCGGRSARRRGARRPSRASGARRGCAHRTR